MYRCKTCGEVSEPRQVQLRFPVIRTAGPLKGTIETELPVCSSCLSDLKSGHSPVTLRYVHGIEKQAPIPVPVIAPQNVPVKIVPKSIALGRKG